MDILKAQKCDKCRQYEGVCSCFVVSCLNFPYLSKVYSFMNNSCSFWNVAKIDDSERLRPEELNQQNIEALVAENNLVLDRQILFPFLLLMVWMQYLHIYKLHISLVEISTELY